MGKVMLIPAKRQVGNNERKEENPRLKVAAYCRVSTDSDEQATSYDAQVKHYTEYIQKNPEWEFAGIYAEIIVPYMIRLRFRDFVKECKNLLIYRLSHTEGCAKVLFFAYEFTVYSFEGSQRGVQLLNFAHPYNDKTVP